MPFRIVFDRKRKDKPQVIVLCDVSDSVRNVSRFMLQFVYSLQDLYSMVRSFIFGADVGETTKLFEHLDIHEAIESTLQGNIINVYAHSDFGRTLKNFHRDYLSAVSHRGGRRHCGEEDSASHGEHEKTGQDATGVAEATAPTP